MAHLKGIFLDKLHRFCAWFLRLMMFFLFIQINLIRDIISNQSWIEIRLLFFSSSVKVSKN